ncbi:hypothetical protein FJZ31_04850 [Candidatus Poribacteria bacterium]|nr:hypothetical protein [Candidatus Poribacteria bacterium]
MFSRRSNLFRVGITLIVIGVVQSMTAVEIEAGTWTQKADMPTAKWMSSATVVDGKICVIGGSLWEYDSIAVVEEYDPATDTWARRADMPSTRYGHSVAAVDGIIYAIGGLDNHPHTRPQYVSTVEAYDPAADKWTKKANMPVSRTQMATVALDGKIYAIGGFNSVYIPPVIHSIVQVYDPATDTWTRKADMPTARAEAAACVMDGRIYVSGGHIDVELESCVSTVEVYDPATDTWTQASDMPWARRAHSASVVDGKMYLVGGVNWEMIELFLEGKIDEGKLDESFSTIDVYDAATDTWTTAADLPTPRCYHDDAVVDGRIYVIGGLDGPSTLLYTVEEFDPSLPGAISSVSPAGKLLETWGQIKKAQ